MIDFARERERMVEAHLARRDIEDPRVLDAFRAVPREAFVPEESLSTAYADAPLAIEEAQTISQPYIVALTAEALGLRGGERVLEVGTGSGYAAAILSRLAARVVTIERFASLADAARERLARLGYENVEVECGDGTLGWPAEAPYDAIAVAAAGPRPPPALLEQLTIGGRLVIPVGGEDEQQRLVRITRDGPSSYREETLADVKFVPLVGEQGFRDGLWGRTPLLSAAPARAEASVATLVREASEPITSIDDAALDALLDRIGDARVVLLGEATHGTSEFYRMRARITRELVSRRGFDFVAVEADWPDAARVDEYVVGSSRRSGVPFTPFGRFPSWMWRNEEVHDLVEWLRATNADRTEKVGFHGLDLYSLFTSIAAVLAYLDEVDPEAARVARRRYGTLTPWQRDPAAYGRAVLVGRYRSSEPAVVAMLREMLERRMDYARRDGDRFFDAVQNARVVAGAEKYYRAVYYGSAESWNLRDGHMFETLRSLLSFYGPASKGVVWAHNSHVGDAAATEMSDLGEHNLGELCRGDFGDGAYIVGFGTDHGFVAAANDWDEPMEEMRVRPAQAGSYEGLCHDARVPAFLLPLRRPRRAELRDELLAPRLERAIGVVYRPETEIASHYFRACLPLQVDEWIWFDETRAVHPLAARPRLRASELPETYPFGL